MLRNENKEESTFEHWLQKHVEETLNFHKKMKTQPTADLR